jgi:hypothetical protein
MLKKSTQGAGEYSKHAVVQNVERTVWTSLTALSTYLSQSETITHQMEEEKKKAKPKNK